MLKRFICLLIVLSTCWTLLPTQIGATEELPPTVEEAIANWKEDVRRRYADISALEIEFAQEWEIVRDRYLRVDIHCTLYHDGLSHPLTTTRSFHATLSDSKLLDLEYFLINGGFNRIQEEIADETGSTASLINWSLTEDGLTLHPARGSNANGIDLTEDVQSEVLIWDGSVIWPNRPMMALTFDDGPSGKTPRLLDILDAYGVRATFFVVGNMIGGREELLREMYAAGHEVGGHSWNHADLSELDFDAVYSQLLRTKNNIDDATGGNSCLMRPPYGASNGTVSSAAGTLGLSVTFWNIDTLDWMYLDADKVYDVIMAEAKNGRIVLCHDLYESTVDAMERVIPALLKQGYQLITVSELRSY